FFKVARRRVETAGTRSPTKRQPRGNPGDAKPRACGTSVLWPPGYRMGRFASVGSTAEEGERMNTVRKIAGSMAVAGMALGSFAGPAHADPAADEQGFVNRINELRASRGLGQLVVDSRLV